MVVDSKRILLFPPVDSFHRLLIHTIVAEEFPGLKSFSVGEGEDRRTAICLESEYKEISPMEQDVEQRSRSSYQGRNWGHDDRYEVAPPEPVHDDRSKPQGDRKNRVRSKRPDQQIYVPRSKRPDQQIYVPRARRGPHCDVEQRPGVAHEEVHDDIGAHENQMDPKPRSRQGKGRGRASMERYIPKAKRNAGHNESSGSLPEEAACVTSPKDDERVGDTAKSSSHSHEHAKKIRSKKTKRDSEREVKSLDNSISVDSNVPSNENKSPEHDRTLEHDHLAMIPNDSDRGDLSHPQGVEVISNFPEDSEIPEGQSQRDLVQVNCTDTEQGGVRSDSMEVESNVSNEKVSSENVVDENIGNLEVPEEVEDSQSNDAPLESAETAAEEKGVYDLSAKQSDDVSIHSTFEQEQDKDLVNAEDSADDECPSMSENYLIKRENSFVENFEADKTLQVHYSEDCRYDMELETRKGAGEMLETTESINEAGDCENEESGCDPTSFAPSKRRKSEDAHIDWEELKARTGSGQMDDSYHGDHVDDGNNVTTTVVESNCPVDTQKTEPTDVCISDKQDSAMTAGSVCTEANIESDCSNVPDGNKNDEFAMEVSSVASSVPEQEREESKSVPEETKLPEETQVAKDSEETTNTSDSIETTEDSWDAMFDDDGEALDPSIMEELTQKVGKVKVQKTQFDYLEFQPADPELDDEAYAHLVEIYDFPSDFITRDILAVFRSFQDKGFDLKWVDDTHCIGVFSSKIAAQTALGLSNPLIKVRPISSASRQTKLKAKKCATFLEPYKPRPVTTAAVARNLVTNALGLTSRVPREKREEERRKLREAKEKKKEAQQLKNDIWDGKVGRCAMDEV